MKKITSYYNYFLFVGITIFSAYFIIFITPSIFGTYQLICGFIKNENDYEEKRCIAENNVSMLDRLILYHEKCDRNEGEINNLLKTRYDLICKPLSDSAVYSKYMQQSERNATIAYRLVRYHQICQKDQNLANMLLERYYDIQLNIMNKTDLNE